MKAKELADKLLKYPDFDIKFHDCYQEFSGGLLTCDSWVNIDVIDIGHSDKVIVLGGEIE